jgi:hypothetical protein
LQCILDPIGVLEPNELFFRSSHANLAVPDGTEADIITGDILITRDPCRLPTDVQKVNITVDVFLSALKAVLVESGRCITIALFEGRDCFIGQRSSSGGGLAGRR